MAIKISNTTVINDSRQLENITNLKTVGGQSILGTGDIPTGGALTIDNKTSAYTVVAGDLGKIINCTSGTFTVSLTAAATLGAGFNVTIWNTGTGVITVDPAGSETIDGVATLILRQGEGMQIVCDGTNWQTGDKKAMRGYAENFASNAARPVASTSNALALGQNVTASGSGSVAIATWGGATASGAGSLAVQNATASSNFSTGIGMNSNGGGSQAVTGAGAMALGGSYASGTDSFAAAIGSNSNTYGAKGANSIALGFRATTTGSYSTAIGQQASATNTNSIALGFNSLGSSNSGIAIGVNATASGTASVALGSGWFFSGTIASGISSIAIGDGSSATQNFSTALGGGSSSSVIGKYAYAGGSFAAAGDSQTGTFVLRRATTDATPTALTTDNSTPGTTDQVILPNNSAYAFSGIIVARQQASQGTASAAWKVEGLIRREGSAGTTVLVNSALTVIDNTPGWTLALSADTTNGGLAITATGAAATNIRWVATIQTSEVTY
jgi:hypothetical protein